MRSVVLSLAACCVAGCHLLESPAAPTPHVAWLDPYPFPSPGAPAFDGARVYFATRDGKVVAVDAQTGAQIWATSVSQPSATDQGQWPNLFGCTVVRELVICGYNDLVGMRLSDGALVWRFAPTSAGAPTSHEPATIDSTIFAISNPGQLLAIDAASGAVRWSARASEYAAYAFMDVIADSDIVVAPYSGSVASTLGGVIAFDVRTGQTRWTTTFPAQGSTTVSGGRTVAFWKTLVLATCEDGNIYALNRATGSILWELTGVLAPGSRKDRQIAIKDSILYLASEQEPFRAFDLNRRKSLWQSATIGGLDGKRIVVDDDAVYVNSSGELVAFSSKDSGILWESTDGGGYLSRPIVGPYAIFALGNRGLYALNR